MQEISSNSRKKRDIQTEDDEIENSRGVKRIRNRTMPEVAGKIACIELENFMCHKTLKMNFDVYERNCSYIVGANGSGKSAIFASINIGLGGSGRSNERGKNVQDYIKEGEEDATIRIHLTNEGPNAIPEYDNIIIVERRITQKTSQFILKSRSGNKEQILHKKNVKHELDLILQQFNIELDNPLLWLSQDRARQFLQSMKPEKLYELYRQSSEMDSTEQLFRNIDLLFKELTKIFKTMDNEKKAKEEKYHEEKARFDAVTTLKEKKMMVQKLLWFQLWAPIRHWRNEIVSINEKLAENTTKKNDNLKLRNDLMKRIEQIEKDLNQKGQDSEKLTSRTKEHNDRLNKMKQNIRKLSFESGENETQIKILERKVLTVDEELKQGRKGLEELLGNSNRNLDEEKQTLLKQQNDIAEQIQKIGEEKEKNATEFRSADEDYQNERQIYQNKYSEYVQTDNLLKRTIEEKRAFERSKVNILNLFGQDMPNLVKLIENNAHLFTKKPIGPIGNYIKLRDHRWADPVEYILKNLMGVILCNSVEDRKLLDEICTNNQIRKPQIVTTNFTQFKFDVSQNEPESIYNTIARMIEVEEPTAFNFIVDRTQAECLLLFEQDEIARKEMYPNAPENASKALTLSCSEVNPQRGRRPYQFVHNQFRSRIFANRAMANEARDFDGQIRALEQNKIQKVAECKKFELTVKSKYDKITHLRQKRVEIENKLMEVNQQRYGIEEELRKLEDIMTSQDRIVNMQNSIKEFEEERKKYLAQLETKRSAYREINEKITEHQDKLDASQHTSVYFKNQFNQIQNDIDSFHLQQRRIQERVAGIQQNLRKFDNLERDYNSELQEKENSIGRQRKEAESKGLEMEEVLRENPEIGDGPLTPQLELIPETTELNKQLNTIQREIRIQEENQQEPLTAEELQKLEKAYRRFKKKVKEWEKRYEVLNRIIEKRKEAFETIAASLPRKLELWFKEYMNFRGFKGSIVVNDFEGTIHIHVETHKLTELDEATPIKIPEKRTRGRNIERDGVIEKRNTRKKQIMQDLRGLSGGERSYTTACFIMSLWKCMESPFRLMDEFDVFMDMVNRRVIMEMLADLAKDTQKIQFFFFTPQPIHELKRDEFEVFQLKKIHGRIFGDQDG